MAITSYETFEDFETMFAERGVDVDRLDPPLKDDVVNAWPFGSIDDEREDNDDLWAREQGPWLDDMAQWLKDRMAE